MTTEESFLDLVSKNRQRIFRVCRYYVSLNEIMSVDDLFQEIILNLWRSYPKYVQNADCQTSTWVYRVALNVAISEAREHRKVTKIGIEEKHNGDAEDGEKAEQVESLYRRINRLGNEDKALVFLYLEDKTHKEMAEIMGISVSNVGTRIQRIKLKLKQMNDE